MGVRCFWLEPTGDAEVKYRDGSVRIVPYGPPRSTDEDVDWKAILGEGWTSCSPRYRRVDTGEIRTNPHQFGPGAMYDAWWYKAEDPQPGSHWLRPHPDGRAIVVICPNGFDWCIDSRANNCTMKDDVEHHCWIRHGEPPNLTVDKNGRTCNAGGGSIQAGDYHGFLRNGEFT